MIVVSKYKAEVDEKSGKIHIKGLTTEKCQKCGEWLTSFGYRDRHAIKPDGKTVIYRLRRLRCRSCGKIHTEIPACIVPHKYYDAESISNPLCCAAEDSTIKRWKGKQKHEYKDDDLKEFSEMWKAGEYEPAGSFCLNLDELEVIEVLQEEEKP